MHNRVDVVQTCYNLDLGPSKHDEDRVGSVQVVYTSVYRYRCSLSTDHFRYYKSQDLDSWLARSLRMFESLFGREFSAHRLGKKYNVDRYANS